MAIVAWTSDTVAKADVDAKIRNKSAAGSITRGNHSDALHSAINKMFAAGGGAITVTTSGGANIVHDGGGSPTFSDGGSGTGTLTAGGSNILSVEFTADSAAGGSYTLTHDTSRTPDHRAYNAGSGVAIFTNATLNSDTEYEMTGVGSAISAKFKVLF